MDIRWRDLLIRTHYKKTVLRRAGSFRNVYWWQVGHGTAKDVPIHSCPTECPTFLANCEPAFREQYRFVNN